MFQGWENFYLIVGPSAGALIGLMFVVVTLSQGRDPQQYEAGKHFYTSPIIWHLAVVLGLSAAALAPPVTPMLFGVAVGVFALIGIAFGLRSTIGIARHRLTGEDTMFDTWFYGILPTATYIAMAASAVAMLLGRRWAEAAVAGSLMALLMVSIHAEWDLVTFLAPRANADKKS
jgi:hypothetical protein